MRAARTRFITTRRGKPTWAHEVGEALRIRREMLGLNQREAVDLWNKSQSAVSEIEGGLRVDVMQYIEYADVLKADLAVTFGPGDQIRFRLTPREPR